MFGWHLGCLVVPYFMQIVRIQFLPQVHNRFPGREAPKFAGKLRVISRSKSGRGGTLEWASNDHSERVNQRDPFKTERPQAQNKL